jgi:hypothetical protein
MSWQSSFREVDSGCCEQHDYRSAKELRAGIDDKTGEEAEIAASHGKDERSDSRFSGLVQAALCRVSNYAERSARLGVSSSIDPSQDHRLNSA